MQGQLGAERSIAITFDDLPATRIPSLADARALTTKLLDELAAHRIHAVGFVVESKLDAEPGERGRRIRLLEGWLDAGHELGNHTYSHQRVSGLSVADFEADLLRGEQVTRRLMDDRGCQLRYFRHPMLNTGRDLGQKEAVDAVLARRGYTVAPVTIDSDEFIYAAAYDQARARGDSALMGRLGTDYIRYMASMFSYYERLSLSLLAREPAQVLLLHANWLNADWLPELVGMITRRGYRFVELEFALRDPAYRLPDQYVGTRGHSWLTRWIVTRGLTVPAAPVVPAWVVRARG